MNNVLVSAVITTHNRCDLLKKAISSVLSQTHQNIECIVVDDASEDNTLEYCSALNEITYIRIEKEDSRGGNYARNLGIKKAKGEYVAFLDDDDIWDVTKIEKQLGVFQEDKNTGVVFCGITVIDGEGNVIRKTLPSVKRKEDVRKKILYSIFTVTSALMIKKKLLFEVGLFDEELGFWQEYELTIRLAQITQLDYVDEHLLYYLSNQNDKKRLTNKLHPWRKAVAYVHEKHKKLYDQLNFLQRLQCKCLVLTNAKVRAKNSGLSEEYKRLNRKRILLRVFIRFLELPNLIINKLK